GKSRVSSPKPMSKCTRTAYGFLVAAPPGIISESTPCSPPGRGAKAKAASSSSPGLMDIVGGSHCPGGKAPPRVTVPTAVPAGLRKAKEAGASTSCTSVLMYAWLVPPTPTTRSVATLLKDGKLLRVNRGESESRSPPAVKEPPWPLARMLVALGRYQTKTFF